MTIRSTDIEKCNTTRGLNLGPQVHQSNALRIEIIRQVRIYVIKCQHGKMFNLCLTNQWAAEHLNIKGGISINNGEKLQAWRHVPICHSKFNNLNVE